MPVLIIFCKNMYLDIRLSDVIIERKPRPVSRVAEATVYVITPLHRCPVGVAREVLKKQMARCITRWINGLLLLLIVS